MVVLYSMRRHSLLSTTDITRLTSMEFNATSMLDITPNINPHAENREPSPMLPIAKPNITANDAAIARIDVCCLREACVI